MNIELKEIINEAIEELKDELSQESNLIDSTDDIDASLSVEDEILKDFGDEDEENEFDEELNESIKNMRGLIERMGVEHKSRPKNKSVLREHYEVKY